MKMQGGIASMISIKRKEVYYGGEPDIFLGNWTKRSPIDEENQEFDITRRIRGIKVFHICYSKL